MAGLRRLLKKSVGRLFGNGIWLYDSPAKEFENEAAILSKNNGSVFCWDVHLLTVQKRRAALAMNCGSRYSILLYGLSAADWKRLPDMIQSEIRAAILREGLSEFEAIRYFTLGGPLKISRFHGPETVSGLNWAMRLLLQHVSLLDDIRLSQLQIAYILNGEMYHAAEFSMRGNPRELFLMGFQRL